MITDIRYVAVMVEKLEEGVKAWQDLFGLQANNEPSVNQWGIRSQMLGNGERSIVEVMEPASADAAVARMMEERKNPRNPRGEGIYMISIEVDDLQAALKEMEAKGGRVTREEGNERTAWVHPLSLHQVFVEVTQRGNRQETQPD